MRVANEPWFDIAAGTCGKLAALPNRITLSFAILERVDDSMRSGVESSKWQEKAMLGPSFLITRLPRWLDEESACPF
jgi:hypothetical protein